MADQGDGGPRCARAENEVIGESTTRLGVADEVGAGEIVGEETGHLVATVPIVGERVFLHQLGELLLHGGRAGCNEGVRFIDAPLGRTHHAAVYLAPDGPPTSCSRRTSSLAARILLRRRQSPCSIRRSSAV